MHHPGVALLVGTASGLRTVRRGGAASGLREGSPEDQIVHPSLYKDNLSEEK